MTDPDDDYEAPVGEVLDDDTVCELIAERNGFSITGLLGVIPGWPFI